MNNTNRIQKHFAPLALLLLFVSFSPLPALSQRSHLNQEDEPSQRGAMVFRQFLVMNAVVANATIYTFINSNQNSYGYYSLQNESWHRIPMPVDGKFYRLEGMAPYLRQDATLTVTLRVNQSDTALSTTCTGSDARCISMDQDNVVTVQEGDFVSLSFTHTGDTDPGGSPRYATLIFEGSFPAPPDGSNPTSTPTALVSTPTPLIPTPTGTPVESPTATATETGTSTPTPEAAAATIETEGSENWLVLGSFVLLLFLGARRFGFPG